MCAWWSRPPEQAASGESAFGACETSIASVKAKADHNERLARWATALIVVGSALIPLALLLSTQGGGFLWGKLVPALLAMLSAVAAGLLQFERPHERWRLYRGYQRAFEDQRLRCENELDPYQGLEPAEREQRLAAEVAALRLRLHQDWSGLVPASSTVATAPAAAPPGSGDGGGT